MKNIEIDIKNGTFKKVYLIYGEENYLKRFYKIKLKSAICGDDTSMNYNYYEGKATKPSDVIGVSETLPFFADKRLILLENTGFFKSSCDDMAEYIERIPESTCMVYIESEIDKRSKMFKKVKDAGYVCEINYQSESYISRWVLSQIGRNGRKITNETMSLFLSYTGLDMENVANELEKLLSYTLGREVIENSDVEAVCTPQISGKIFDMIDAIGCKNMHKSIELYNNLITSKEPPMRILYMLSRQFNIILKVKELNAKRFSRDDISKNVGIQSFLVTKAIKQAEGFTMNGLVNALDDCVTAEEDVKNGRLDEMIAVESLIIKYSRK